MILLAQILVTTDFILGENDYRHEFLVPDATAQTEHSPSGGLS